MKENQENLTISPPSKRGLIYHVKTYGYENFYVGIDHFLVHIAGSF
jgi:hypothetical protein